MKAYQENKNRSFQDSISIGNYNWDVTIQTKWKLRETCDEYLKPILSFISGNPNLSQHMKSNHDVLLAYLNSFYTTKLLSEYDLLEFEQVGFTNPAIRDNFYKGKDAIIDSLYSILDHFKKNIPLHQSPKDIFFLFELNIITMHLIKAEQKDQKNPEISNFVNTTDERFLTSFRRILSNMNQIINANNSLNNNDSYISNYSIYFSESLIDGISKIDNDRLNYYSNSYIFEYAFSKYIFNLIIFSYNFYSIPFKRAFDNFEANSKLKNTYLEIKKLYDNIIYQYFEVNIKLNLSFIKSSMNIVAISSISNKSMDEFMKSYKLENLHKVIFTLGFCLDEHVIKAGLERLSQCIDTSSYENFSNEISKIFRTKANLLKRELAELHVENDNAGRLEKISKINFIDCVTRDDKDISKQDKDMLEKYFKILSSNYNPENNHQQEVQGIVIPIIKMCVGFIVNNKFIESERVIRNYSEIIDMFSSFFKLTGKYNI